MFKAKAYPAPSLGPGHLTRQPSTDELDVYYPMAPRMSLLGARLDLRDRACPLSAQLFSPAQSSLFHGCQSSSNIVL
jgi:hypothetical protein